MITITKINIGGDKHEPARHGPEPVSYTHLDVYKRQPRTLDAGALKRAVPGIRHAAPLSVCNVPLRFAGRTTALRIVGTTPDLADAMNLRMAHGRFLSPFDRDATFAVVGAEAALALGTPGQPLVPGDSLQIGGYLYQVIGITRGMKAVSYTHLDVYKRQSRW